MHSCLCHMAYTANHCQVGHNRLYYRSLVSIIIPGENCTYFYYTFDLPILMQGCAHWLSRPVRSYSTAVLSCYICSYMEGPQTYQVLHIGRQAHTSALHLTLSHFINYVILMPRADPQQTTCYAHNIKFNS